MTTPTPFIRPFDSSRDFNAGLHVFLTTISPSLNWEPARTIGSYLWYKSYVSLTPSTCVVLDDGTGRVIGYCIGTSDTSSFSQRWRAVFAPVIDPKLVPRPETQTGNAHMERDDIRGFRRAVYAGECSMLLAWPQALGQWQAHFHVDVLPEWQRRGFGRRLVEVFCAEVKRLGAGGVHLDMLGTNAVGRAFYESLGFGVCPVVLDGGVSGEVGINGGVVTLVRGL